MNVEVTSSEYIINDVIDNRAYKGKANIFVDGGVKIDLSIDNIIYINYGKNSSGEIYINVTYTEDYDIMPSLMNIINNILTSIGYND